MDNPSGVARTSKRKRKRTNSIIPVALSLTPPCSQISSEETALERAKREAEAALALERAKREESDYARTLEISNFSEMNDRLQSSVAMMLEKAEESQAALAAEREEKEEL